MRYTTQQIEYLVDKYPDPNARKQFIQDNLVLTWAVNNYGRGTFVGATGVGKSRMGVLAAERQFNKKPDSIVYVLTPTEALRDIDWPEEFTKWGSKALVNKIKFLCHASMSDEIVQGEVDLVLFDECHHATPLNCTFFSNNRVWSIFALTATFPNAVQDPDKWDILNRLCPVFFQIPIEDAVSLKLVAEFEIKTLLFDLDDTKKYVISGPKKNPIAATELEHYKYLTKKIQSAIIKKIHPLILKFSGERARYLCRLKTREQIAREVMGHLMTDEKRTLIFCGSIDQCEELCAPNTFHSKTNDEALKAFRAKILAYLGAVNALNEGQNVPDTDQMIVVQLDSSDRNLIQRIGRIIRWRFGHIGLVVLLVAKGTADEKWYREAISNFDKKRIKEYIIKPKNPI